jgi:hypothetical protein
VDEPFAQLLGDWLVNASPGKLTRLAFLCNVLGLEERTLPHDIYYQLLHRTASAVIEAKRFKTDLAVMLVHSFSPILPETGFVSLRIRNRLADIPTSERAV